MRALVTPGHTVGGTCYLADGYIVTGDLLFVGGCGRTDFRGGDSAEMWRSLQRLTRLPEETRVYPGHDYGQTPTSTIGQECADESVSALPDVRGISRPARTPPERLRLTCRPQRRRARVRLRAAVIFLVGAIQFVNILDFMMVMPLGPDFAKALGIPTAHLGIVGGSYTAAAAVAGLVAAPLPRSLRPAQGAGRWRSSGW